LHTSERAEPIGDASYLASLNQAHRPGLRSSGWRADGQRRRAAGAHLASAHRARL